mmetsp:Transcript_24407/g.61215  ORF Transcript_24407/g.61215 Transcript_24407/m.61215 type:complete len:276 (-) Transcript_24407:161-988(-)|eukprot:CAMPEP_0174247148 /NCGR_PEP_ID=MMETSP0417-20130205/42420_1 /TAXON_ID=242541 /ORGANISM="Mayorella sp, Strain BSH-02190019" /LENGTH=275 /DNA_ID=CAMNT_0015327001 /DNA_START=917 /DNA_END=1744 /DNA_ORIENTATION=-
MSSVTSISDHQVPVLLDLLNVEDLFSTPGVDLAVKRVLPWINGKRHAREISILAEVDPLLVRGALQQLLNSGFIVTTDVYQPSNVYLSTDELALFYRRCYFNPALRLSCCRSVAVDSSASSEHLPRIKHVFTVLLAFEQASSVQAIVDDLNPAQYSIDVQRLVSFALINQLLRRVHSYIVPANVTAVEALTEHNYQYGHSSYLHHSHHLSDYTESAFERYIVFNYAPRIVDIVLSMLMSDSSPHHLDAYCCLLERTPEFVEQLVESDSKYMILRW